MNITLYQFPVSHYCARARICLYEKGLEFSTPPLPGGGTRTPEFLSINPLGKTPVIIDGDAIITESESIAEYLDAVYPTPPLLPSDEAQKAKVRSLSRFHDLQVGPQLSKLYFGLSDGLVTSEAGGNAANELVDMLKLLESMIEPAPYLMGENFYTCDAAFALSYWYVPTLLGAYQTPFDKGVFPKLEAWAKAVGERESVAKTITLAKEALG